jgi:hypothetical protein
MRGYVESKFRPPTPSTNSDPATLNGWAPRIQLGVLDERSRGCAAGVGEFVTSVVYGNLTITKNLALAPTDFTQFSVTSPIDPNLPGGGGQVIAGSTISIEQDRLRGVRQQLLHVCRCLRRADRSLEWRRLHHQRAAAAGRPAAGRCHGKTLTDNCAVTAQAPEVGTLTAPSPVESPY